jgi:hypothetical protein
MSSLRKPGLRPFSSRFNVKSLLPRALAVTTALFSGGFYVAYACGPFSLDAIFTYSKHPDYPLEKYAQGELGILQPTYARSYLLVAYRYLNGIRFAPDEKKALLSLWNERLSDQRPEPAGVEVWLAARKKITGKEPPVPIDVYRNKNKDSYDSFLNCTSDAFETAAKTLTARVAKFGATNPDIKAWTETQDRVFANCSGENIPEPAASNTAPWFQQDRTYQIAAANFYAMKFDNARTQFEKIAEDTNSPWRAAASFLKARTLIRQASLGEPSSSPTALQQAQIQLDKTLADPSQRAFHQSAQNLSNLVKLRLKPEERLRELAQVLASQEPDTNLKQDLWDYTLLLDKYEQEANPNYYEAIKFNQLSKVGRENDMTDWVLTFQAQDPEALAYALRKWEQTASVPWLIASLSKVSAKDAKAPDLMKAALAIQPDSPAFLSANAQLTRLLLASGQPTEAKKRLDFLLNSSSPGLIQPSAKNYFLHQRMLLANNLDEFLKFAQRSPAAFSWDYDGRELPATGGNNKDVKVWQGRFLFDTDATQVMNERLPLSVLKEATAQKVLPDYLRQRVALAAWTRAALLEDGEQSKALAPVVSSFYPELKPYLDSYLLASTAQERKAAALYILLKFPTLRPLVDPITGQTMSRDLSKIDNYRGNWWCAQETKDSSSTGSANFLNATQEAAGKREHDQIAALGPAPNYLSRQAVEWARRTPNDSRVPEALHLAVRSTRYGCSDKQTGRLSKAAFDLLKTRYASSPWAKKTKYWFKG